MVTSTLSDSNRISDAIRIGEWTFHASLFRLECGRKTIKLEPRVAKLLFYLAENAGKPVGREKLMEKVWPGTVVGDEALTNAINKLRKAFDDDRQNPHVIETIPKAGYRLIAKVEQINSPDPAPAGESAHARESAATRHWLQRCQPIVAIIALVLTIYALWNPFRLDGKESPVLADQAALSNKSSIAVLPFDNFNKENDYFSDGITDDLITDLSKISGITVIARNSVFTYKRQTVKIQQIAEELGATHVLVGSIQRAGNSIRINAQFIDAATGHHLWAERYDRDFSNIFELQDEITEKIVSALKVRLTDQERSSLIKKYTNNVDAYDLFLKGQQEFLKFTKEGNSEARRYYQMAIELDPEFARATANLGWTYARDFQDGWTSNANKSLDKALELALKAKSLDQTSSRVHWVLGQVYLYKRDYEQAIANVKKAIDLSPSNPDTKILLARVLAFSGDPTESIRLIKEAIGINPLYPMQYQMNLGIAHFANGEYGKAEKALSIASDRNPGAQRVRMWLVATYANAGNLEAAKWEFNELLMINPNFSLETIQHSIPFRDKSVRDKLFNGIEISSRH